MKKILLIEDEKLLSDLLQKKLSDNGYYVFVAGDGETGLQLVREKQPDLVLLDLFLPRLNGMEVLRDMGRDEKLKRIPVVIISNSGQPVEIDKAKELGARDWLVKTEFDPSEVLEKVVKQIGPGDEIGQKEKERVSS